MKYFLDDLISIGVVADDGREYCACNREAKLHRVSDWVRENVLVQLPPYYSSAWKTRGQIALDLAFFCGAGYGGVASEKPEFWGYYADYDWVALCQLYGAMIKLPPHFPKFCMDLKQLSVMKGNPKHPKQMDGEHNALKDARWNRNLYEFLMRLPYDEKWR